MKNILFIAYQFPPLNVGGSARPARFVKHLHKHGFKPTVVTLDPQSYGNVFTSFKDDSNLFDDVKEQHFEVLKVPSENMQHRRASKFKNFIDIFFNKFKGNEAAYWEQHYHQKVDAWLQSNKTEAIVVTAPPFGILPLAVTTAKKHNLPLIVDMRDHWTLWGTAPYSSYYTYWASKRAENRVFKQASKIIATSEVTVKDLINFHPNIERNKFVYIPNGYEEPIDFNNILYRPSEQITVGYVGSFYYTPRSREQIMTPWWKKKAHRKLQYVHRKEDWLYRSPYYFLKTLRELFNTYPDLKHRIKVKFAGKKEDWFDDMLHEFDMKTIVEHVGWLSQSESLNFQNSCDFLLITSAKVHGGKDYSIAGKTFEYFRMQKPILALVADGAQKDILSQSGMAHFISIDNLKLAAEQLYKVFTTETVLTPNKTFIDSFHTENLTKQLAKAIKDIIK